MTRERSDNYDIKRDLIIQKAAVRFSNAGYPSTKMNEIAEDCGVSKSMLYHYFPTKDDVLFAMLEEYLSTLVSAVEEVVDSEDHPEEKLLGLLEAYSLKATPDSQRHIVAMNDSKYLSEEKRVPLKNLESELLNLFSKLLKEVNPKLPSHLSKSYALLLIGMLNWAELWYRPGGYMSAEEFRSRVRNLFLHGFLSVDGVQAE